MDPVTQQVIQFLSHPELPFGTEEDVLLLADPSSLRERVIALLEESPSVLGAEQSRTLSSRLTQADWPLIAQEFQARVDTAASFFDADAQPSNSSH